ncbi:MAG: hypothetical protein ACLSDJ_12060, partial [Butyricimonas faecihominis]
MTKLKYLFQHCNNLNLFFDKIITAQQHHDKFIIHTTIDYSFYFFSSSGVTLSNLNSNAFTEINISFTEIP